MSLGAAGAIERGGREVPLREEDGLPENSPVSGDRSERGCLGD